MINTPQTQLLIRTRNFLNSTQTDESLRLAAEINEAFPEINAPKNPPLPSDEMQAFGTNKKISGATTQPE